MSAYDKKKIRSKGKCNALKWTGVRNVGGVGRGKKRVLRGGGKKVGISVKSHRKKKSRGSHRGAPVRDRKKYRVPRFATNPLGGGDSSDARQGTNELGRGNKMNELDSEGGGGGGWFLQGHRRREMRRLLILRHTSSIARVTIKEIMEKKGN